MSSYMKHDVSVIVLQYKSLCIIWIIDIFVQFTRKILAFNSRYIK